MVIRFLMLTNSPENQTSRFFRYYRNLSQIETKLIFAILCFPKPQFDQTFVCYQGGLLYVRGNSFTQNLDHGAQLTNYH